MLLLENIQLSISGRLLVDAATASIPTGAKVGVVGRNGTGKTTLFRLIRGELSQDGGEVRIPRGWRIGGVAQEAPATQDPLVDIVLSHDRERASLLDEAETATDPARIAEIQLRLTDIEAHSAEARAASILSGLGFDAAAQARPAAEYSGGWRMRVALAGVLFSRPDILLLDEPTNYLDLEGTVWLENYLAALRSTVLVISHDRSLLNRAVGAILHLHDQTLTWYTGNYDQFDAERRAKLDQNRALKVKQDAQRAHIQKFVDRFRYKASKAKQAQSRLKMLERLGPVSALAEDRTTGFTFDAPEELPPPLVNIDAAIAGYDGKPVLKGLNLRIDQDDRIALLGRNGEGKSTLAKLIAGKLAPMSGGVARSNKLRIGYFAQHQLDELVEEDTPLQHIARLRPEEPPAKRRARLAAGGIGVDIADTRVENLSGGQKARLMLAIAAIDKPHLLILDEPTNHLDIDSRDALSHALNDYAGAVILISHDPHLVDSVADRLWLVRNGAVAPYTGDMADYRDMLLSENRGKPARREKPAKPDRKAPKPPVKSMNDLKADVRTCESRLEKLNAMLGEIDDLLADPDLYDMNEVARLTRLQKKRAEILDGVARAEDLWLAATERLEAVTP